MKQGNKVMAVATILVAGIIPALFADADANPKPADTGLSQLLDARGLSDPLYRWNARLVWPAQPPAAADMRDSNVTAWTFDDGNLAGITKFSGIDNPRVENGVLQFQTGEKAYFYWGDHFDDPDVPGLDLTFPPPDFLYRGRQGWTVRMRVRQSLPESHWTVSTRRAGAPAVLSRETLVLKGTNWQEVSVLFTVRLGLSNPGPRFHSLCFEPGEPGNRIEIDWVRASECRQVCGLRKTIVLKEKPASAQICLLPETACRLFVNGREVYSGQGMLRRSLAVMDIGPQLAAGKNTIAYEAVYGDNVRFDRKKMEEQAQVWEGIVHYPDGSFQRVYTEGREKALFNPPAGWAERDFDDSAWPDVLAGPALADSTLPGRSRNGFGMFIDPPYMGPIRAEYINAVQPEDAPPFFRHKDGIEVSFGLPDCFKADGSISCALEDALNGGKILEQKLATSDGQPGVFAFRARPEHPGVYNLIVRAESGGKLLDTRIMEMALIGRIPQPELPWDKVKAAVKKRLVADIACGNPDDPHPFIEHPYYHGQGPKPELPQTPMTRVVEMLGQPCRETTERYGDWFGYRVQVEHPDKPHIVEVEYPDDRPQNFAVRAYYKGRAEYRNVGDLGFSSPAFWALSGSPLHPSTGRMQTGRFLFYPRRNDISVEVTNLRRGGKSAVARLRVYEIEELPATAVPQAEPGRLFGSQTERANLILRSFYAWPDYDMFAYSTGGTHLHEHTGWAKRWLHAITEHIRYMRYSGENAFFCNFYQYSGSQAYFPIRMPGNRGAATPRNDPFAMMFAMFAENGLALIPCVEFCYSYQTAMLNCYTDKEVRAGAPAITVISKDGRQMLPSGAKWNYNPFNPAVQREMAAVIDEIVARYGRYASFRGIQVFAGGLFMPALYADPRASDWREVLEYGWEDDTMRLFEERTSIKPPVDFNDPGRFAKRFQWVTQNCREEWIEFRCREMQGIHQRLRDVIRAHNPQADYMLFLANNAPNVMAEYVVLQGQPINEALRMIGQDPDLYKNQPGIRLGWVYYPESFNWVNNSTLPGTFAAFNRDPALNASFDAGTNTAAFVNVVWQEPDVYNSLYPDWVWSGGSQQNPNPWFGNRHYPEPFADRLLQQTPSLLMFVFTDGHLYTAESDLRRPIAAAFRSLPMGEYRTLEGNGLDRNLTTRELVRDGRRYIYLVNPAWWNLNGELAFTPGAEVRDRVNQSALETDRAGRVKLDWAPYAVRVLEMPETAKLLAAEAEIDGEAAAWLKARMELFDYWNQLGGLATVRRLGFDERPETISRLVRAIQGDYAAGYYARSLEGLQHPIVVELLKYLELRREKEQAGTMPRPQAGYRVLLGRDAAYTDHAGNTWLPDQFYAHGLEQYGYTGRASVPVHRGNIPIANTADPDIYRGERFKFDSYCFQVPNGRYKVRLHFAEGFRFGVGDRLVDLFVEDRLVLPKFDFNQAAGAFRTAYVREIENVEVADNELVIRAVPAYNFKLNAIEVERQG